jgi:hypothetical protein
MVLCDWSRVWDSVEARWFLAGFCTGCCTIAAAACPVVVDLVIALR